MPSTIRDLTELTAVAANDYLLISDTSDVTNRDKRIAISNLQINLAQKTGTPVLNRVASWLDSNTVQDAGYLASDVARLSVGQTYTGKPTFNAGIGVMSMYYQLLTVNANAVQSITPLDSTPGMMIFPVTGGSGNHWGLFAIRVDASGFIIPFVMGTATGVGTGVPTGTTGASNFVTVFAGLDGKIYIENRRGVNIQFKIVLY